MASNASLSARAGTPPSSTPARRSAAAVPVPIAHTIRRFGPRRDDSAAAARTALGLVNTTMGEASAVRSAARVAASVCASMRIVDRAMQRRPAFVAARRTGPCWPTGRKEIT